MRILLDECVPRPLRRELTGHNVRTIQEMGWAGKKNGELLTLMAGAGFAPSNRLADLVPLMPAVEAALSSIRVGNAVEVRA